ncbi:right-handed parallel beta-helix repeat-containing protein [Pseudolysobacter antarcticus]|uniref:Right-handed parallel beta-helix repeat-containing protein n=1 Tax=Pseudolysobacter antarcticus TaxID=2511995 RepID=A0A411HI38_9GAMM|nr:right-handed parallel beta-helix repeat-containing protein [Pseudolysobacter antarcticus]QBB70178.1 right-handed parallel beta-helix repeat-containing protein [Pseudolysobacter antarcticus]
MKCRFSKFSPIFVLALLPLVTSANPGALEINQDCAAVGCFAGDTPGFPVTITQPGSYILTSDLLTTDVNMDAIDVSVSSVDLDLNGHTLNGGGTCTGTPVTACSGFAGTSGISAIIGPNTPVVIHIHNGTVHGFSNFGIVVGAAADGTLIDHISAYENGNSGVAISGTLNVATTARIRDSQISRNKLTGVVSPTASTLLVENSTVTGNGQIGLFFRSASMAVGNRINNNGSQGLYCIGYTCVLGQNVFMGNNAAGAQFAVGTLSDMGGNVCTDHPSSACP